MKTLMKGVVGDNQGSLEGCAGHCLYEVRKIGEDDEGYDRLSIDPFKNKWRRGVQSRGFKLLARKAYVGVRQLWDRRSYLAV